MAALHTGDPPFRVVCGLAVGDVKFRLEMDPKVGSGPWSGHADDPTAHPEAPEPAPEDQ